jgi:MFS transporter, DHA1 family, tetracycline resistance protein
MQARDRRRLRLCLFLWGAGEGLFVYLLPLYIRSLGGDATAVGLTFAIQFAVAGASTLLAGPAVDRLGQRPLIRATALVAAPGVVIWALAPHWQWMIPGTVLFAISFGVIPALNAYVSTGDDDHVGAFGSTFAFFSLGMIVTPGLGGLIAAHFHSIRAVFALTLVLYAASIGVVWNITPQPIEPHEPLGTALRALGANRRLLVLCAYLVALLFIMSMTNSFVGPYLQDVDHAGDAAVGLLGSCISLGEFLMGVSLGRVNQRLGRVRTLVALQAALALSLLLMLTVHWVPALAPAFILRGAIITLGTMVIAFVGGVLPARRQGAGFGLMETGFQAGMMAAAYAGGLLYAGGPARPFVVSLALLAVTGTATVVLGPLFAAAPWQAVGEQIHAAR